MEEVVFEMLSEVKDKITGYEGVVTAKCEYSTGCVQYEITPTSLKDKLPQKEVWLDWQRLVLVKQKPPENKRKLKSNEYMYMGQILTKTRGGGPGDHPPARSHPE